MLSHTTTTCEEDLGGQLPRNEYNIPRTSRKKGGERGNDKGLSMKFLPPPFLRKDETKILSWNNQYPL